MVLLCFLLVHLSALILFHVNSAACLLCPWFLSYKDQPRAARPTETARAGSSRLCLCVHSPSLVPL